jgi:hypothetical protein
VIVPPARRRRRRPAAGRALSSEQSSFGGGRPVLPRCVRRSLPPPGGRASAWFGRRSARSRAQTPLTGWACRELFWLCP